MTVAGVKTARPRPRSRGTGGRSDRPVVVARATLAVPPVPPTPPAVEPPGHELRPARRSDLHLARRQRRRDALAGLGVLAAALGATVAILDVFH